MKPKLLLITLLLALATLPLAGQGNYIQVRVSAEKPGWTYSVGEPVSFRIEVVKNNNLLEDVAVIYEISENLVYPSSTGDTTLRHGHLTLNVDSLDKPGFIRCVVKAIYEGREYRGIATAAVEPHRIETTTTEPSDFRSYWKEAIEENNRLLMDPRLRLLPERCTGDVDVYELSLQSGYPGARVYGILCVPKAPGKYPALLTLPGAGIRPYAGSIHLASQGYITLEIGIHGVSVTQPQSFYSDLANGPLRDYTYIKLDDRDHYYYKRVYLGCVRAVDYLYSMPEFDGENLAVRGGSQGGALAIVTASLDNRVKALSAFYPALCDLTGYLHSRAGGWPHFFNYSDATPERIRTTTYYDVVNFARYINIPGFYSLGYNDITCPPTSMYSALNVIDAPKEIFLIEDLGHYSIPEQWIREEKWLNSVLKRIKD